MLVTSVMPQIVAQLESVETFGSSTSETDVGSIRVAQVTSARFLKGVQEIAVAEDLVPVFSDLLAMAFGDNFAVNEDGKWTLVLPDKLRTGADSRAIVIAFKGMTEIIPALKSKKRKAPDERADLEVNNGLTNEALMDSFPHMGNVSEEHLRGLMKDLCMDPPSLRDQQKLKDAAAEIAAGTAPKSLHGTASGTQSLIGLDALFSHNNADRTLAINSDNQIVSRTSGSQDNRFIWNTKANTLIESLPPNSEIRKRAIIYRDSFGLIGEYFPWPMVMEFDGQLRELIASGAPVDINMNSIHSLFLLQNAAKSQFSSGAHEPASEFKRQLKRQVTEKQDFKKRGPDFSARSKSKGFCDYFNKSKPEGGHMCRKQNCQFAHKCALCSNSGHGAYACTKSNK